MGYITHVRGEFTIEPPLTWAEFKDSEFASDHIGAPDLVLRVAEESVDTADGPLLKRTATALVMREIDEYRAHNLLTQVQKAVDAFPGHTFTGRLECEGEENTDIWRVIVRDGRALKIMPRIIWPDEDGGQ